MSAAQYELIVDVCGRPLLSNDTRHRMVLAKKKKEWRDAGCVLARAAKIPLLSSVTVAAWGVYPTRTMPDAGGIAPSVKAVLDGIVDAGVLPDDRPPFVVCESYYPPLHVKGCQPGLVVLLTECEPSWRHPGEAS